MTSQFPFSSFGLSAVRFLALLTALLLECPSVLAQGPTGSTSVSLNQTEEYTFSDQVIFADPHWSITGGDGTPSQSGLTYTVTITWNVVGMGNVTFMDGGATLGSLDVNVDGPMTPDPPSEIYTINVGSNFFNVLWTAVNGATDYQLDVSTNSGFSSFVTGYESLSGFGTTTQVSGLSPNTTYYWRVRSVNSYLASDNSSTSTVFTGPPAPVAADGSNGTQSTFVANWAPSVGAIRYRLDVSTNPANSPNNGFSTGIITGYNNLEVYGTSKEVTGLSTLTAYYYRVRAENGGGLSNNSSPITMVTATGPPSVYNHTSVTTTSFTANWSPVTGADSYYLEVSTNSNFTPLLNGYDPLSVSGTTPSVTGLNPGTRYYYRVRTRNSYGSLSNYSFPVEVTTIPIAPTPTAADPISESYFQANWGPVDGADSYWIDVSTSSEFPEPFASYEAYTTNFVVQGIAGSTTYYYRVRAENSSGESSNSNVISVLTVPAAPIDLTGSAIASGSFDASWSSTGVNSYNLDVSTSSSFVPLVNGYDNLPVTGTTKEVIGLTANTVYYFRVRANNATGPSFNSVSGSVKTATIAPTATTATSPKVFSFVANWDPVSGATSYELDVSTNSDFTSMVGTFNNLPAGGFTVDNLSPLTIYHYRVRAVNNLGTVSANSNPITVTTATFTPVANNGSAIGQTTFLASWSSIVDASYLLCVSTNPSCLPCLVQYNGLPLTATSHTVTGLSANTTYYYKVKAVIGAESSPDSNIPTVLTIPSVPSSLNASLITSDSFNAAWSNTGASSYRIDLSTSSGFENIVLGYDNLYVGGSNAVVTGLLQKTTYYFRVRSVNSSGVSASSAGFLAVNLDYNYIRTVDVTRAGITTEAQVDAAAINEKSVKHDFVDGLGRPIQTVMMKQSPNQSDVVQAISYDGFGREAIKHLPFVAGSDGWYKLNFRPASDPAYSWSINPQYEFYDGTAKVATDSKPYAVTVFEASPLNRVLEQGSPGVDFQPDATNSYSSADRAIKMDYLTNLANEVLLWTHSGPSVTHPLGMVNAGTVAAPVYYGQNQLTKTKTKDEEFNEVIEYKDKSGRVVLKRVQAVTGPPAINDTNYASTYYVYDNLGQLAYVIPPEATKRLVAEFHSVSAVNKETFMRRWAFRYKYDKRRRMVLKQIPGSDSVRMVYDNRDRLILTQDGNQRTGTTGTVKYWSFTKYDLLNRTILTGIKDTTTTTQLTQTQMQAVVDAHFAKASARWGESFVGSVTGNVHGYSNLAYPVRTGSTAGEVNANKYNTVTYYDDYGFRTLWTGAWTYLNENLGETVNGVVYQMPSNEFGRVVGQVTGSKVKVLDGDATFNFTWLRSVNYYDDRYRMIQSLSDNYKGGTDRVSNVVDFTGKVLETKSTHFEQDIAWKDLVGAAVVGNKLNRTLGGNGWTVGAVSTTQLPAGQNGWLELSVDEITSNRIWGLADTNPDASYTSIDYAFYLSTVTLRVYENGVSKLVVPGPCAVGDILRIERNGATITYKKNGTTVYTSLTPSSTTLMADVSIFTSLRTIAGARASFSSSTRTTVRRFEYDHAGRMMSIRHQLDAEPEVILLANEYNALGQLVDKKLHSADAGSTYKQSVDYRYNIRGWLEAINNSRLEVNTATNDDTEDLFGMELKYNLQDPDLGNAQLFNGNISGVKWSNYPGTGPTKEKAYTYGYDPLNRITSSAYREKTTSWNTLANNGFAETGFTYDMNGNILTLTRNDGRASGTMDALTYDYTNSGNQLLKVSDSGDDYKGFVDGANVTNDYTYDPNGNMTRDLNKGIGTSLTDNVNIITYNFLNLPVTVTKGGNSVRYVYDASGRKLWQAATFVGSLKQTDYAGEYIYENDALQFINHEEGRISIASNTLVYTNPAEVSSDFMAVNATIAQVTLNGTEKYISVTSSGTTARTGVFPVGGAFPVTGGEKYRIRVKGYRTGASAAYIQAKASGTDIIWPGASIASNVASESWIEQMVIIPAGATTLEVGVNWNTVTNGEIMYINEVEITKLATTAPEYQYHLKDHLGNVRTTFTSVTSVDQQTATLEDANLNTEQGQFLRITTAKRVNATIFDHSNGESTGYSERLNGSANEKYGVAKSISVMPGDVIDAEVYGKYVDQNSSNWTGALTTLMGQIAAGQSGVVYDGANYGTSTSSFPFGGLLSTAGSTGGPKAYINWLIFDRNYVLLNGGYQRMSAAPMEQGQDVAHELMSSPSITITQAGYVYIYVSNEETSPVEVYFDDFKVTHVKSPVISSDDYYPGGALFNSFTRENSVLNKYKYQSKELQTDLGLDLSDFGPRWYDGWTLRTTTHDPHAENYYPWSPYSWAFGNPTRFSDPTGMDPEDPISIGTLFSKAVESVTTFFSFHFGDGNDGSAESAANLSQAHSTLEAVGVEAQSMKAELQETVAGTPLASIGNWMDAQQSKTGGEAAGHFVKGMVNLNAIPVGGGKTHQTYSKPGPKGEVYSGRTSGKGTPEQNVAKRDASHHMNKEGFGKAVLDKSSTNKGAIRGREQMLIDKNGGAKSQGGTSGNKINGISPSNPKKQQYIDQAKKEF